MRIVCLMENTEGNAGCLCEHGLSFYVETVKHKLLVDTGASDAFLVNAEKLGVDLKEVDTVILSHGHYDHSGGILPFAEQNKRAPILMQTSAMDAYYHKDDKGERYIGIEPAIRELPQLKLLDGNVGLDEELLVFGGVTGRRLWPLGNMELKIKKEGAFYQDEFEHEQYLVITQGDKQILISGCAHNGILNILEKYREMFGEDPYAVFSGFHMRKKTGYTKEDVQTIKEIAEELKDYQTLFFTGHCTGEEPFEMMKEIMGEQLVYVRSGDEVQI